MAKRKNRQRSRRGKADKTKSVRDDKRGRLAGAPQDLPELQQARALWIQNRFPEALRLFEKAIRKDRHNPIALADAARAYGARFEFARAQQLLGRLVDVAGNRADLLQMAGQSYRMIQRPDRAIECLQGALELSAELFEARLELALLFERRHQLDAAMEQIAECLDRNPGSCEAQLLRGRLLRRMGKASDAEPILRDVASHEPNHAIVRAQAWHELGQLLDEAEQFDDAYEAVKLGKEVQRAEASQVLRRATIEADRLENLLDSLTSDHFRAWRDQTASLPSRRVAMLTGPPRSGTTLLERVLDNHPEVVTSDEQSALPTYILPSLFLQRQADELLAASDLDSIPLASLRDQRERYLQYLSDARGEPFGQRMHIDKNPSIILLIPGMLRLFPESRLLIAIRDPRDVAVSCFMRYLPMNTVSAQFLTLAGAIRRNRRDLDAWFRLRELISSPWLEVRYEDTVNDLEREARRALQFLGVGWDDSIMDYRQTLDQRQVNSPTYEDVAKPVYRSAIGRWRNYERHFGDALEMASPLLKELGYDS